MNLLEFKKKHQDTFKRLKNKNSYVVYYANTEVCTATGYIDIMKANDGVGYVSKDNYGYEQKTIRGGCPKDALIHHLFMNDDEYGIIQGIE